MPTANARGHQVPTGGEQPSRTGWVLNPLLSINDFVIVATATARDAAIAALSASATRPLFTWRADGGLFRKMEVSDGTTTEPVLYGGRKSAALTLANSWTDTGAGGFAGLTATRDATGHVQLHGEVSRASGAAAGSTVVTIPAGYRPAAAESFKMVSRAGVVYSVYVTAAGAVVLHNAFSGSVSGVALSEIHYYSSDFPDG